MKELKTFLTPLQELEQAAEQAKKDLRKKQYPKKNAPDLDSGMLVTLSKCAFRVYKQSKGQLVLKADEKINFDNQINEIRVVSYICGVYDEVSIGGWLWRPVRYKGVKLYLKAVSPV